MEQTAAPPPPPPISAATTAAATHPDSLDSSPRSRKTNSWTEENGSTAAVAAAAAAAAGGLTKLRLMCSYGGHIVPRPHDKSLCYVGGDTRIVVVDRHTTLSDLTLRLAKTLLRSPVTSASFTVKYQLPSEDLDSLISVTTDEDLENMIDEYERLNLSSDGGKSSRLRLFLFPAKPEPASISSIGSLLESSTKSEDWFLNALNGTSSLGFSDTSSVNCLLGLEEDVLIKEKKDVNCNKVFHDVQSVPDSPMLETTSSFGSASSSPSLANLPPVRVNGDDQQKVLRHQDDVGLVGATAPVVVTGVPVVSKVAIVENPNPNLKQQQYLQKQSMGFDLASPDSVSSDGSVTNPLSRRKPTLIYQDPISQTQFSTNNNNNNHGDQIQNNRIPTLQQQQQQIQDSAYLMSTSTPQVDPPQPHPQLHHQSQFIHTAIPPPQYIHHHPSGAAVPMASYYPMYPSQNQHHSPHPALDQHNFVYYMPTRQPINSQVPPNNQVPPPSGLFTTPRTVQTATKTEPPTGVYRTTNSGAPAPQLVQVPSSQHPQYVGYSHIHQPSQSVAPSAAGNYAYEFADHPSQQGQHIYYAAQPLAPPQAASQYQTMASTLPVEVGSHVQTDNRTSQP